MQSSRKTSAVVMTCQIFLRQPCLVSRGSLNSSTWNGPGTRTLLRPKILFSVVATICIRQERFVKMGELFTTVVKRALTQAKQKYLCGNIPLVLVRAVPGVLISLLAFDNRVAKVSAKQSLTVPTRRGFMTAPS